jgi:hypothetical protein
LDYSPIRSDAPEVQRKLHETTDCCLLIEVNLAEKVDRISKWPSPAARNGKPLFDNPSPKGIQSYFDF